MDNEFKIGQVIKIKRAYKFVAPPTELRFEVGTLGIICDGGLQEAGYLVEFNIPVQRSGNVSKIIVPVPPSCFDLANPSEKPNERISNATILEWLKDKPTAPLGGAVPPGFVWGLCMDLLDARKKGDHT